jgi:hypothetical protein
MQFLMSYLIAEIFIAKKLLFRNIVRVGEGRAKSKCGEVLRRNGLNYCSIGPRTTGLPKLFSSVSRQRLRKIDYAAHYFPFAGEQTFFREKNFLDNILIYIFFNSSLKFSFDHVDFDLWCPPSKYSINRSN